MLHFCLAEIIVQSVGVAIHLAQNVCERVDHALAHVTSVASLIVTKAPLSEPNHSVEVGCRA